MNRANDPAYQAWGMEAIKRDREVAEVRMEIAREMTQHVERVRAALPADADDAALAAALAKDAAWRTLEARAKEQQELAQKFWEENRDRMRDRILEERQAAQDVAAGKAKAITNSPPQGAGAVRKKE